MNEADRIFIKANELYQTGQFENARSLYESLLELVPNHADVLYRIAGTWYQTNNHVIALDYIEKAIEQAPDRPEFHFHKGVIASFMNKTADAVKAYETAIKLKPDYYDACNNIGMILHNQKSYEEAELYFLRAISFNPDAHEAFHNLANLYFDRNESAKAIAYYQKTLALRPDHLHALLKSAILLEQMNKIHDAIDCFQKAIQCNPDNIHPYFELANFYYRQKEMDSALKNYQAVVERQPGHTLALNNIGHIMEHQGRYSEAIQFYNKALKIKPDPLYHYNKGICLQCLGDHTNAVHELSIVISKEPNHAEAHLARAESLLKTGDFQKGWADYEWRIQFPYFKKRIRYPKNAIRWDGSPLSQGRLVVFGEQGFGDTFQFIRYIPLIKTSETKTVFVTRSPVLSLMNYFPGIDELIDRASNKTIQGATHYIELLSLPKLMGTTLDTIPSVVSFNLKNCDRKQPWKKHLSGINQKKVGLVWAGSRLHINDHNRSCSLDHFLPHLDIQGLTWISLQKDENASQINQFGCEKKILDLSHEIDDFLDTALIINQLDLVISVDTAVAHLAATLGKPTWILLPYSFDWRWLMQREDSPWYPSVRLFRQNKAHGWEELLSNLKEALTCYAQHC